MSKGKVVCVDDERAVLISLRDQLTRLLGSDYDIELAESGEEALEILSELQQAKTEVPLIISDQIMPAMKGDELLIQIHNQSPKTLKILLTGQATLDAVVNAVNAANLYRFIAKPWNETDLGLTVREAIRSYSQDKQLVEQNLTLHRINQELQMLTTSLEQIVAERTSELRSAIDQLETARAAAEAANLAKSTFLANMSHELRTPLNAILGFTQLLSRDGSLTADQKAQIAIVNRSGEHLLALINDILAMSKIEAGRASFKPHNFDLHALLDNLKAMLQLKAESKGLVLRFEVAADIPQYVCMDEGKLRQVLINLLGNAIKFTDCGRVTLRVSHWEIGEAIASNNAEASNPNNLAVWDLATSSLQGLCFEVEDTGCGIMPSAIPTLFDPFVQASSRVSQEGTGLGLAISHQFVYLMGGELQVESTLGRGSRFWFWIRYAPVTVVDQSVQRFDRQVTQLAPNQPNYRVLVVEDIWTNRKLMVQLMASVGFDVREAENGQQAIDCWRTWHPHLIWMDMQMAVMDGYEATRQIRTLESTLDRPSSTDQPTTTTDKRPPTKIIALTASVFEEDMSAVLKAGCDDVVRKPFQEKIIFEKIAQQLGVTYLYEESDAPVGQMTEGAFATSHDISSEDLRDWPLAWLKKLHQAALKGQENLVVNLVEELPTPRSDLKSVIIAWASEFRFDKIVELITPLL